MRTTRSERARVSSCRFISLNNISSGKCLLISSNNFRVFALCRYGSDAVCQRWHLATTNSSLWSLSQCFTFNHQNTEKSIESLFIHFVGLLFSLSLSFLFALDFFSFFLFVLFRLTKENFLPSFLILCYLWSSSTFGFIWRSGTFSWFRSHIKQEAEKSMKSLQYCRTMQKQIDATM